MMDTRQASLEELLSNMAEELPEVHWAALVDLDGLVMACVPQEPAVEVERISAMTAAVVTIGERLLTEVEGGQFRFISVAGSLRKQLTVALSKDLFLSIGMAPSVQDQSTFKPIGRWGPKLLEMLTKRLD